MSTVTTLYAVKPGDTLASVSEKFYSGDDSYADMLASDNNLSGPDASLVPGTVIKVASLGVQAPSVTTDPATGMQTITATAPSWIQTNWKWVAIGAGVLIAAYLLSKQKR